MDHQLRVQSLRLGIRVVLYTTCLTVWLQSVQGEQPIPPSPFATGRPASDVASLLDSDEPAITTDMTTTASPAAGPVNLETGAAEGLSLSLLEAWGQSFSPNLRQAAAEVEAARGRAIQAGLYPNPVASGGALQLGGRDSQYFVNLSQEIVTRHKLHLAQAAVCQEVYQAEQRYIKVRFALLTAIRQRYFAALAGQKRIAVLERLVQMQRAFKENANERIQAGVGTRSDRLQLEIEVEKSEVALDNARVTLAATYGQLAATLGQRELQINQVEGDPHASFERFEQLVLVEGYLPDNADVRIANSEVERERWLLERQRAEPYSNITVNAGYVRQYIGNEHLGVVGISAPLPLWNRNEGNITAGRAGVSRAQANVAQVENTLADEMLLLGGRYRSASQLVMRYEERIIPLARESIALVREAFDQEESDFLRLLQSQRALVDAQLGYLDVLETRWQTAAQIAGLAQVEVFP